MKKSEIVGRVALQMELNKCVAEGAVDTVLEAIGEALAKDEDVRTAGFGKYATRSRLARADGIPRTVEEYRHKIYTRPAGSETSLADRDDAFAIGGPSEPPRLAPVVLFNESRYGGFAFLE